MASATMAAPTIPKLNPERVKAWTSSQICYLVLRTSAVRWQLLEALAGDPRPKDRELVHLFSAAVGLFERELRRRALEEQLSRSLAIEDLDPAQVVEIG